MTVAPAAASALAQAMMVPPDETISSTIRTGRPANMAGHEIQSRPSGRRGGSFSATVWDRPSRPARSLTQWQGFRIRPHHDGRGVEPGLPQGVGYGRHRREIVGLDAGKHRLDVGRAVQMGIDGNDPVDASGEQRADDALADGLAPVKRRILPHVA